MYMARRSSAGLIRKNFNNFWSMLLFCPGVYTLMRTFYEHIVFIKICNLLNVLFAFTRVIFETNLRWIVEIFKRSF